MPVKDIQPTTPRFSRLGIIRLGMKQTKEVNGKQVEYPSDADHFVMTDAPGLVDAYGEQPDQLLIYLPFGTVDANFPAYHELWTATGCLCRGDGQVIASLLDPTDGITRVVRDGRVARTYTDQDGTIFEPGDIARCPGLEHDLYARCADCRPSGMLLVMVRDPGRPMQLVGDRLGYYQIRTHSFYNIQNITGQLLAVEEIASRMGRDLRGIPMILRRVPREIIYTDTKKGERRTTTKRLLDLEFDIEWVKLANVTMHQIALSSTGVEVHALPAGTHVDPDTGEILDDDFEDADVRDVTPPGNGRSRATGAAAASRLKETTQKIQQNGLKYQRPWPPEVLQEQIAIKVRKKSALNGPVTDAQKTTLVLALNSFFEDLDEPDKYRHSLLRYLVGKDSASNLSKAEASVIIDWAKSGEALSEARAVSRQDALIRGQTEMSFDDDDQPAT